MVACDVHLPVFSLELGVVELDGIENHVPKQILAQYVVGMLDEDVGYRDTVIV